jgi:CDP-diacylglycerol--serine O-phosphatidyltransferase
MKKHIPNFLTICNLLCGSCAVFFGFRAILDGRFDLPLYFILAAAAFDFLDGFAARLLKAYSDIGKQLDSLADMISFGLAPSAVLTAVIGSTHMQVPDFLPFAAFLTAAFSALRLAKFNIDDRQTSSFIGLPTPANAIFFAGTANSYHAQMADFPYIVILLMLLFCFLLVCNLPMFSLKFKNYGWKGNEFPYILLVGAVILLIFLQLNAFAWIIALYILLSVIKKIIKI